MSCMVKHLISASAVTLSLWAVSAQAQTPETQWRQGIGGSEQPGVPQTMVDVSEGNIPAALARWKQLSASANYAFSEYASFLITYPDWPGSEDMRKNAESAINVLTWSPSQAVAFFDRLPPLTNAGQAKYAIALDAMGDKDRARKEARKAWRGGALTDDDETRVQAIAGNSLNAADHDARADKLLWAGAFRAANRVVPLTSDARRPAFMAALAAKQKSPEALALLDAAGDAVRSESSLISARVEQLKAAGNLDAARELLASRKTLVTAPPVAKDWYKLLLTHAKAARAAGQYDVAYRIASKVQDGLAPDLRMIDQDLSTRNNYTDLLWLAGNTAMKELGNPAGAVGMFRLYAENAKTPQTKSKGYYYAARAAARAGDNANASRLYASAGQYFENFYGQLALEALGKPMPQVPQTAQLPQISSNEAPSAYLAAQLATKYGSWKDQSVFVRSIGMNAKSQQEYLSAMSLSKQLGRPDLSVIAGRAARVSGFDQFVRFAYPTVNVPDSLMDNYTLIHAIARQESQFDKAAISHAGARGLMQLMPGTARETAGKLAMAYRADALTSEPEYNIQLGNNYIQRMLKYYDGSYPLAVAAYNAGPGNVNKWLRANGDPRYGSISMLEWLEKIPVDETRDYVQRVLENAVMYDHLNPEHARFRGSMPLSSYLGKSTPG